MTKENTITIDLDIWTTPKKKADLYKKSESYYRQRIHRTRIGEAKAEGIEEYWEIPELNLILVKK